MGSAALAEDGERSAPGGGLAGRVLRPARARLPEAIACVTSLWHNSLTVGNPAEAWEALESRGLLPPGTVGDARRRFVAPCDACNGEGRVVEYDPRARATVVRNGRVGYVPCTACGDARRRGPGTVLAPHPACVRDACLLAGDWPGVLAAEALATEACARLAPWGFPRPRAVAWRVVDRAWRYSRTAPTWRKLAGVASRPHGFEYARVGTRPAFDRHDAALRDADPGLAEWTRGAVANLLLFEAAWPPPAPNPFAPLVDLWRAGYALGEVDAERAELVAMEER